MAPWFTLSQSVKCRNRGIENTPDLHHCALMICTHSKLILLVFQDGALGQQGQEASHGAEAQNGCEKSYEPASAEQL